MYIISSQLRFFFIIKLNGFIHPAKGYIVFGNPRLLLYIWYPSFRLNRNYSAIFGEK